MMDRKILRAPKELMRFITHRLDRGMSLTHDIRDWLGGWPMQFVADKEVIDFLAQRGFVQKNILTGKACTEFLFQKKA